MRGKSKEKPTLEARELTTMKAADQHQLNARFSLELSQIPVPPMWILQTDDRQSSLCTSL